MEKDDLQKLKENKNLEYKKAKNKVPKSFWETYSAFANINGGTVIFGLDEKTNQIEGVIDPNKIKNDLFNMLNNSQKVSHNIIKDENVDIISINHETQIVVIEVPEASYHLKPIYINGNPRQAFERFGEGDRLLTQEKYKALIVGSKEQTDNELLKAYDLSDLCEKDLEIYKEELYKQTGNEKYLKNNYESILIEIGAMRKDRQGDGNYYLTTGGLLFFGKTNSITDRFPGFQLDYFEKDSSLASAWLDRVSSGDATHPQINVYSFFRNVLEKLKVTIKEEFVIDSDTQTRLPFRNELLTSIREALVYSLMHAYYDSETPIKITAYPDYYEFVNPGKMRITVKEFIHGGVSNIRNQTMSSILRRIGISEKAGSGGPRIFDIASKYKLKLPEIIREQDKTVVRIWKVDIAKTFEHYPENQQKLLFYLVENQFISRSEANEKLKMDNYTFRTNIDILLKKNLIEVIGKGRSTKYVLKMSSSEHSYSIKRYLRTIEDKIIHRDI